MMLDEEIEEAEEYTKNLEDRVHNLESELALYKSKTPHTKDGVPIFLKSRIWHRYEGVVMELLIMCIQYEPDEDDTLLYASEISDHRYPIVYPSDCYSSREKLEAAMEGWSDND